MLHDRLRFAEVQFFFYHHDHGFALVSLFGLENRFLRNLSRQVVWACPAPQENLIVIDVKSIISGVAMIPHTFRNLMHANGGLYDQELYFAVDQLGADIHGLDEGEAVDVE